MGCWWPTSRVGSSSLTRPRVVSGLSARQIRSTVEVSTNSSSRTRSLRSMNCAQRCAPVTSIRGLSDLLLKYPVPEAKTHALLETIYSASVRMNELINRYPDLTRIEYGAQTLTRAPVATNNLIAECVRALSPMAAEKGIHIIQRLEGPSPSLLADAQLLTQAVNNLLSNAIKYSPTGLTVEIGTDSDDA